MPLNKKRPLITDGGRLIVNQSVIPYSLPAGAPNLSPFSSWYRLGGFEPGFGSPQAVRKSAAKIIANIEYFIQNLLFYLESKTTYKLINIFLTSLTTGYTPKMIYPNYFDYYIN